MKRAGGQCSTQAASVPLLGRDPEAAETITLCDAAQACKCLTRPAVVRGSPAPNVEISPQELTTYDAHSGSASCGLVPQHDRVQWRMMICIAPPAHAGGDSLGTPVTHLLQDMLGRGGEVSALGRCCTSSHACLSPEGRHSAAVSRTSELPNGLLCVGLENKTLIPLGVVSLSRRGSICTGRQLVTPVGLLHPRTSRDPGGPHMRARGSSSDTRTCAS